MQQLSIFPARLLFSTAGTPWPWEGFETSWLKFNISPAVAATTVAWEHEQPLLLPCASLS